MEDPGLWSFDENGLFLLIYMYGQKWPRKAARSLPVGPLHATYQQSVLTTT